MTISPAVLNELKTLAETSRVFLSMPFVPGITPAILEQEGRFERAETTEGIERRHGIFRMNEAALSPLDHGGLYGDAVFEGILIQSGRIFLLKEHLKRWWVSAKKMDIVFPYTMLDMAEWILETVRQVGFADDQKGYLRPVLSRGFGNLGINPAKCLAPTVYVIASTIQLYPEATYGTGIELAIARKTRRAGQTIEDPNVKSNNYLNNINGLFETRAEGKLETLMLSAEGHIAEATADNIFLVRLGEGWQDDPSRVLIETPTSDICLEGITRNLVMQEARAKGYTVVERGDMLSIDLVGGGREAFMTGTGCGIMPIIGVGGVQTGDGVPGEVTKGLLGRVRERMCEDAYALSFSATRDELAAYLEAPDAVVWPTGDHR
jgi:branched-chain amino acid aminotransferase